HIKSLSDLGWMEYKQGDKSQGQSNTYKLNLSRLGLVSEKKVVPMTDAYIASDGSRWACASDYWKSRQVNI
ncbi:hypothetical protein, partial [Vibrio parahaemolyticus]